MSESNQSADSIEKGAPIPNNVINANVPQWKRFANRLDPELMGTWTLCPSPENLKPILAQLEALWNDRLFPDVFEALLNNMVQKTIHALTEAGLMGTLKLEQVTLIMANLFHGCAEVACKTVELMGQRSWNVHL